MAPSIAHACDDPSLENSASERQPDDYDGSNRPGSVCLRSSCEPGSGGARRGRGFSPLFEHITGPVRFFMP